MRLLQLPAHLTSWGLRVVEIDGWRTRGAAFPRMPQIVVAHHTGTAAKAKGDLPTQHVLVNGRADLSGPLCQVGLGRSGTVYVIASGIAHHAGKGAWDGINVGNTASVGIEAEHPGSGPWPAVQLAAYYLLGAALLDLLDQPSRRLCAHRESAQPAGRKVDPAGIDMNVMRASVGRLLAAGPRPTPLAPATRPGPTAVTHKGPEPTTVQEDDDMPKTLLIDPSTKIRYVLTLDGNSGTRKEIDAYWWGVYSRRGAIVATDQAEIAEILRRTRLVK